MPFAPPDRLAERHARIRASLREADLEALVVTHLPNIFYLSNFAGSAAIVVLTLKDLWFITDSRYAAAVEADLGSSSGCPAASLVRVERTYDETLVDVLGRVKVRRVGFEAARLSVSRHDWLRSALRIRRAEASTEKRGRRPHPADRARGLSLVPTERLVEAARLRKDAGEIATLRTAAGLLSDVATRIPGEIRPGRTEREVAAAIEWTLKQVGFERAAFDTMVASGPHAAMPHWRAGGRALERGDLVVIDFGGVYDGYCVDLTRTVSLGPPDAEARRVYDAVAEAQAAAIAAVRPGALASAVDAAAREALGRHGLADAFRHGTGHGLGIEVHEEPRIAKRRAEEDRVGRRPGSSHDRDETLGPGMVVTVEPGAYLPGWGGVRIEDDVLVTADGCEVLTTAPRDLLVR